MDDGRDRSGLRVQFAAKPLDTAGEGALGVSGETHGRGLAYGKVPDRLLGNVCHDIDR